MPAVYVRKNAAQRGSGRFGARGEAVPRVRLVALPALRRVRLLAGVADRLERRPELDAQLPRLREQPLVLGERAPLDGPRLAVRLGEDRLRLAPRLLLHLRGGALGGDEGRAQQRLELAVADEVGPLAPDVLEAERDLLEEPVGRRRLVAQQAPWGLHVPDLDRCERHRVLP